MNIIFFFAILCVCAVQVRSMRKEAPSLNDLLFFNGITQKPQQIDAKNEINVLPEDLEAGNEIDVSNVLLDLLSSHKEQKLEKESKASPSNTDEYVEVSKMLHDLNSAQKNKIVDQKTKAPSTNKEIEISDLLNDLFSRKDEGVQVITKSPEQKMNEEFDVSELFRDSNSAPEKQVVEQETTVPSQTEVVFDVSDILRDLFPQQEQEVKRLPKTHSENNEKIKFLEVLTDMFPQKEQAVNVVPISPTNPHSKVDVSELFRDLISGPEDQLMEPVHESSSKTENSIDISKLLHDPVSPPISVEVISMAAPDIGKEMNIPDLVIEIAPSPKKPEQPVMVEIQEEIISIMPLNDFTKDEKKENLPKPILTTKINELLSDVISPLEQRLLDEFERALVPLNDVIELGADIKNSPFTEEEIKKLELFKVYMQTTQELHSEFTSKVHSFGVNRFYETAVHTHYHLSENQKNHAINVLKDATESVKAESKAVYDLILKTENQQLIKSIENKKLELSASLRAISLALKAKYAHLIDDDKMEDVKTKRLSIIEEYSKSMIEILQSKALETLKDGIIEHVDNLVDIMNKLPMKITLSYMF